MILGRINDQFSYCLTDKASKTFRCTSFTYPPPHAFRYPAWWVTVPALYKAVLPEDNPDYPDDPGRGLIFVWSPPEAPYLLGGAFIPEDMDDGDPILSEPENASAEDREGRDTSATGMAWMLIGAVFVGAVAAIGVLMALATWGGVVRVAWVKRPAADRVVSTGKKILPGSAEEAELSPLVRPSCC